MFDFYKGYVETKDKKCIEKFKNRTDFKTHEQVQSLPEYAGILSENAILIDIDNEEQSRIMFDIVEKLQLRCRVVKTTRGMHFLFKNEDRKVDKCRTGCLLAVGLTADIKVGCKNSYEILKTPDKVRPIIWDIEDDGTEEYQELPKFMRPVNRKSLSFTNMEDGDGRNKELFSYILTLQSHGFTVDEARECIKLINGYVMSEPLEESELDTVLRDEAFQKPTFFDAEHGNRFLFDRMASYLQDTQNAVLIDGQIHIYRDGIYVTGKRELESMMIGIEKSLSDSRRKEVFKYLNLICHEKTQSDARYIAFKNGIYDLVEDKLLPFSPDYVLTNRIPWDYVPGAYDELVDKTLNKLACQDPEIRLLLEECIGYCFYRRNELGKAFILTGEKSNGKSTFLDLIKNMLGDTNISALDLKELGDRFSTANMFGKLANIGDDIGDDFLQGSQVAMFKKVVTGNRIKAEYKGQDPFEFNPYIKLLFSANDIPRMRDKTGAVIRRLCIIPFNARFSKDDPDYDPYIKYKLCQQQAMEYLIKLGIVGLKRILENYDFTHSELVDNQLAEYEQENNPILSFLADTDEEDIIGNATADVYSMYTVFCNANKMTAMSKIVFSRQICSRLNFKVVVKKVNGKSTKVFEAGRK